MYRRLPHKYIPVPVRLDTIIERCDRKPEPRIDVVLRPVIEILEFVVRSAVFIVGVPQLFGQRIRHKDILLCWK